MRRQQPTNPVPRAPVRVTQPSNLQEQSLLFGLPWEIRVDIYKTAYPRITSSQLVYLDVNGTMPFYNVGDTPSAGHRLCRVVCKGVFDDDGAEIRAKRLATQSRRFPASYIEQEQSRYNRPQEELVSPLPLQLTCRRVYEDLASVCDQSLAFQDFLSLEAFFNKVSTGVLESGLLERLAKVSVDLKFSNESLFKPSSRKKVLASWAAGCKRLAALENIKQLQVRVEIPLSQKSSTPGNVHAQIVQELNPLVAHARIRVEMMLTSAVHPKYEHGRLYRPDPSKRAKGGLDVPGWKTKEERLLHWP